MSKADTVDELIDHISTKLDLLLEWRENHDKALVASENNEFEKSDAFDDRCIEIEEIFEDEYGIIFDSYGDIEND